MRDVPGRMQDQPTYRRPERPAVQPFEKPPEIAREEMRGIDLRSSWATVVGPNAPNPGMTVGADLVQVLEGDASSFFISVDPKSGKAALYRYRLPQIDPGEVVGATGRPTHTVDQSAAYCRRLAQKAAVQRELIGAQLKAINAANRAAWEGRGG
jgi:hypothetical protein